MSATTILIFLLKMSTTFPRPTSEKNSSSIKIEIGLGLGPKCIGVVNKT